jgi:hypothetical protein
VSVGTPVLDGRLELESPSVVFGGTPPASGGTFVLLGGITLDVDEGVPLVPVNVIDRYGIDRAARYHAKVGSDAYQEVALVHEPSQ